jgi:hypothetical protein
LRRGVLGSGDQRMAAWSLVKFSSVVTA